MIDRGIHYRFRKSNEWIGKKISKLEHEDKGRSHKQIAYATGRSERTVRQHAVSVYHKSGLNGRAELAAFFLEDILLPESRTSKVP